MCLKNSNCRSPLASLTKPLVGTLLSAMAAVPAATLAQSGQQAQAASDADVIEAWQAKNPGGLVPTLRTEGTGTRLEWTGSVTADRYRNQISSGAGAAGTPLVTGQHYRATAAGDARWIRADGAADHLQFNVLQSNDPAVLRGKHHQIGALQFGRNRAGYAVALGDVAPNFSPLSSALGLRGIWGQADIGRVAMSTYAGQVAESWESWQQRDLRTQPLRSVHGLKLEYPLASTFKAYVTTQGYSDHPASSPFFAGEAESSARNHTVGFNYRSGALGVQAETALSAWESAAGDSRSGQATVIDGTWQGDKWSLRFGAHDVEAAYTSLSLMAKPGISEAYVAADWSLSTRVSLVGDVRRSRQSFLATAFTPAYSIDTDAFSLAANFNFGPDWPGWSGSVQGVHSVARTVDDQKQRNQSANISLNYASAGLAFNLGYGQGHLSNSAAPQQDSDSQQLTWTLRRTLLSGAAGLGGWTAVAGWQGKAQLQTNADGARIRNGDTGLQLSLERAAVGSVNLLLTSGAVTPATGLPSARSRGVQLDASYLPTKTSSIKVYWRHIRLNANYAELAVIERTAGVQLNASF